MTEKKGETTLKIKSVRYIWNDLPFGILPRRMYAHKRLTPLAYQLAGVLKLHAMQKKGKEKPDAFVFPSNETLAREVRRSVPQVIKAKKLLIEAGFIQVERKQRNRPPRYYFSVPVIESIEELESRFDVENFNLTLEDIVLDPDNSPMHTKEQVEMFREYFDNRRKTKK